METKTYDYIVVGSGPAGSIMAKTLSDDGAASVLLLEAGANNDADPLIQDPNANLYRHFPEYFWWGQSIPQPGAQGRDFPVTGGRLAGGGSSVNGEMYVRPTPFILERWAKVAGAQWSPAEATKNFKELENYLGESSNPEVRGTEGLLAIRQNHPTPPELVDKLTVAFERATGRRAIEDYNDPATPIGPFRSWQLYQKPDGQRASASVSFLEPALADAREGNRNLDVRFESTATKILFDNTRATGVRFVERGEQHEAQASKKVIVCAGIHSAQLLMVSGVGPKRELAEAGVDLVADNQHVGRHLADDAYVGAVLSVNPDDIAQLAENDANAKIHGGAFLPSPEDKGEPNERAIQIMATGATPQALYLSVLCVNPESRGTLDIQSADPLKIMLGDFGFLTDDRDVKTLMAALRTYVAPMAEKMGELDPAYALVSPSPEVLADDDKLEEYVRTSFIHTYHDQCSVRMGAEAGAAVDGWGNVFGTENLIVADASIIPYHMDGNTSACAYLIGYTIGKHLAGK